MTENYVPEQRQAREWAARMVARQQFSWDTIAEGADPDGRVLEQDGCDAVAEALATATVILRWPDGTAYSYGPEIR